MPDSVPKIERPELFFGFVAPIGVSCTGAVSAFRAYLETQDYRVIEIKVTDFFDIAKRYIEPEKPLNRKRSYDRYTTYIAYGNQLRKLFGNSCLALGAIRRIMNKRIKYNDRERYTRTAFLIHQFKRKEEIDLLRAVYGRLFFQISLYSRRGSRVDQLSRDFASSANSAGPNNYRNFAEELIIKDENEADVPNGQRITKVFHDADVIVSLDAKESVTSQVNRFCELVFSANDISPRRQEYGLFLAKAAALRSLDLSRQVGAAVFSEAGELLALGSNEVPKGLGGTYWCDEEFDDRDYVRGFDSNQTRKRQIFGELAKLMDQEDKIDELLADQPIKDSQFMDALEYGRIVHAEMSAICDAARTGRSLRGATLYCTTFPCHMCAKHVVASGISKVVFLEPYPKSLANDLHSDSIQIEGGDRGSYSTFPAVSFEHFFGVTPRRYREMFERGRRKNDDGQFEKYIKNCRKPMMNIPHAYYARVETQLISDAAAKVLSKIFPPEETP